MTDFQEHKISYILPDELTDEGHHIVAQFEKRRQTIPKWLNLAVVTNESGLQSFSNASYLVEQHGFFLWSVSVQIEGGWDRLLEVLNDIGRDPGAEKITIMYSHDMI